MQWLIMAGRIHPSLFITGQVIRICRYGSICRMENHVCLRIRMWSAPVEDLSSWRDEGPIFTYQIEGQWDVMYAPDLVEVKRKDGAEEYFISAHLSWRGS